MIRGEYKKNNVIMFLEDGNYTKKLNYFMVQNKFNFLMMRSKLRMHTNITTPIGLKYSSDLIETFPLSLAIAFLVSWFNILCILWYESMTNFYQTMKKIIKQYICEFHNPFHEYKELVDGIIIFKYQLQFKWKIHVCLK